MTSEADGSTATNTYKLTCNDCSFERAVEGSFFDALDVADEHEAAYEDGPTQHFVDLRLSGYERPSSTD